jgi:thioredoxin reductase/Pyruvate/2-oxoacid:ferredoxin oxidoreductase delta subunit
MSVLLLLHQGWLVALGPATLLGLALMGLLIRRGQIHQSARSHREIIAARERGSRAARLLHPVIDLTECIGCGACVRACPEEGVLSLMHGQAVVVHGARCVGHAMCSAACPTGAISLTFADLERRRDLPAITQDLEAVGVPGLFLAGELSGFALVRTAVAHGVAAADAAARRTTPKTTGVLDLLIVGAGPAGLACSLRARELGLDFLTIEQEPHIGGTVAAYPRRKLLMTQPLELPLHGWLNQLSYQKEELVELWQSVTAKHQLPVRTGVRLLELAHPAGELFEARTSDGILRARNVCLALGRRGSPRKLGVPGESLPKVSYSLLDAQSYRDRRILVVGGGDSAAEAAMGLAEQPGNQVTISYRKAAFSRLKARNDTRLHKALHAGALNVLFESELIAVEPDTVQLKLSSGAVRTLPNDEVFIFAGGDPPFTLLEKAGVSFDPTDRPQPAQARGSGLLGSLVLTFLCALMLLIWSWWFRSYYSMDVTTRQESAMHRLLRPAGPVGVWSAVAACGMFLWNLLYLLRRSQRWGRWLPGTLRMWMGLHVFTGISGALCILVHAGFTMRPTAGGHALIALTVVVLTGAIGRYLYAFIPRAANGTETSLDELRAQLANVSAEWDRDGRGFGTRVREQIDTLIAHNRWRPGLLSRLFAMLWGQISLRLSLRHLRQIGRAEAIPADELEQTLMLARRAYRLTLLVMHYQEITAVLSSWRYFHRWLGLLMILLVAVHVATAVRFATLDFHWFRFTWGAP